jgi:hypothetical protein
VLTIYRVGLNNLYSSQNIITVIKSRNMRWVGHVSRMGKMRNTYKILVAELQRKRPRGRHRRRWEVAIKINLKGTGREITEWIHLVRDKV